MRPSSRCFADPHCDQSAGVLSESVLLRAVLDSTCSPASCFGRHPVPCGPLRSPAPSSRSLGSLTDAYCVIHAPGH